MTLRAELFPEGVDISVVRELAALATEAQSCLEARDPRLLDVVERFNTLARVQYEPAAFLFYGYTDPESFARTALLRARVRRYDDINRDELIEIVRKVQEGGEQWETDYWLDLLRVNVPMPDVSDLLFSPHLELTPEQIVDRALNFKELVLEGHSGVLLTKPDKDE